MKIEYKVGDIISYPIPGVLVGKYYENTVNTEVVITKIYEDISEDGVIVDMQPLDKSISEKISGKLLYGKTYKIQK